MKKVAFNRGVLEGYLQFFNCSLADLVGAISTEKTPETRRRKIEEDLKNGEAEFRILRKIAGKFRINIYNFFLGTFSENAFLVEFKGKNPTVSLSADTYHILRYYQNLREDIAVLDEGYENIGGSIVSRNQLAAGMTAAHHTGRNSALTLPCSNRPDMPVLTDSGSASPSPRNFGNTRFAYWPGDTCTEPPY